MDAYGMIETYGLVASIEGADSMVKTANVSIVGRYKVGSGLVTVIIKGDVGAVNAAVIAGRISAERIGKVISTHVIPRPAYDVYSIFEKNDKEDIYIEDGSLEEDIYIVDDPHGKEDTIKDTDDDQKFLLKLSSMKFGDLRIMAKEILKKVSPDELTEKETKLHSKKHVIEFLMNFKHLL